MKQKLKMKNVTFWKSLSAHSMKTKCSCLHIIYSLNTTTLSLKLTIHGCGKKEKYEFAFILAIRN